MSNTSKTQKAHAAMLLLSVACATALSIFPRRAKTYAAMLISSVACAAVALYDDYRALSPLVDTRILQARLTVHEVWKSLAEFAIPFLFVGVVCGSLLARGKRRLARWLFLTSQGALLALYLVFESAMHAPKTGATAAILLSAARLFYSVPIVIAVAVVWLIFG